jgi:rhodanese-related sulfurtransferase
MRAASVLLDLGFDGGVYNVQGGMYAYSGPNLVTGA